MSSGTGEALGENLTVLPPLLSNNISQDKVSVFLMEELVVVCRFAA